MLVFLQVLMDSILATHWSKWDSGPETRSQLQQSQLQTHPTQFPAGSGIELESRQEGTRNGRGSDVMS